MMNLVSIPSGYDRRVIGEICRDHVYDKLIPLEMGMTVVDVGASIGAFSLYAFEKIGKSGRVIAFEPEPLSYNALLENAKANHASNIISVKKALWNESKWIDFYPTKILTGSTFFLSSLGGFGQIPTGESFKVFTCRFDVELPRLGISHVDFVKIDAEGAAMQILEGSTGMLDAVDNFAIAAYHTQENAKQIENFLRSYGFRTKILHRYGFIPFVYATRNPNITLQYVEAWPFVLALGLGGLLLYLLWRRQKA